MRALVLVLVVGCGSSASDADRHACEQAGAAADRTLAQALNVDPKIVPGLEPPNLYTQHCIADGWSAQMRKCLTDAQFGAQLHECERLLTPDQRTQLQDDAAAQIRKRSVPY